MNNVLIASVSLLQRYRDSYSYSILLDECSEKTIEATNTNEIILKTLSKFKSEFIPKEGIQTIIALVTNAVLNQENKIVDYDNKSTYEFYEMIAKQNFPNSIIVPIRLQNPDYSYRSIPIIINEICNHISEDDSIFIDVAGGMRTVSNIIQLLVKILKYKGLKEPLSLYAELDRNRVEDRTSKKGTVSNNKDFTQLTDFADAFNEFMTSGKSDQLYNYYNRQQNMLPEIKSLIDSMKSFSEDIQLGKLYRLESTIKELRKNLEICEKKEENNDIGNVLIKQFLPVIKQKLIGNESTNVDYVRIIDWCIENSLIQQALTIFNEKIPRYLFENRFIRIETNEELDYCKKNKKEWNDIGYFAICNSIRKRNSAEQRSKNEKKIKNFRNFVTNKEEHSENQEIAKIIDKIQKITIKKGIVPIYPNDLTILKESLENRIFTKQLAFFNAVKNLSNEVVIKLLGLKNVDDGQYTLSEFISRLEQNIIPEGYKINVKNPVFANIICGWYYSHERRNAMNHVSTEDITTSDNREILEKYGYRLDNDDSETIKANLKHAIEVIKKLTE